MKNYDLWQRFRPLCVETRLRLILLPLLALSAGCASQREPAPDFGAVTFAARPKNIILLIGDGMGLSQVSAHLYWTGAGKTIFEQFPHVGFHKSHSCNDLVTDSAAGATAFACGEKTTNGAIGVLPLKGQVCDFGSQPASAESRQFSANTLTPLSRPCHTILEELDEWGWATGMVVACTATHATPASFIAHRELRAFTEEIALDYLRTPLDCFVGGGEALFYDRPDRLNLDDSLRQRNYVVRRGTSFRKLPLDGSRPFMLFTADREPPTASGGRQYMPEATRTVCDYLTKRSEKGFFLMVEGSQIDWAGHANDRNWLRAEMTDFDATVREAMLFAARNRETLVLVTGDHECGGLALTQTDNKKQFQPKFSSKLHTAALVPVYAYGPGAERFSGIYENTEVYRKMLEALGLQR
jgi:alkaline phosphatase